MDIIWQNKGVPELSNSAPSLGTRSEPATSVGVRKSGEVLVHTAPVESGMPAALR